MQFARRSRPFRPGVLALETRELATITALDVRAFPRVLTPPNGRFAPITVIGELFETRAHPPAARFQVVDEYRQVQPKGRINLVNLGGGRFGFAFQFRLQASVATSDKPGRLYFISIAATDFDGSLGKTLHVLVPQGPVGLPRGKR